ncbi:MAG: YSC84-related protein [Blastocatellia bacterium]
MKIKFIPQLTFVFALTLAMAIVAPAQDQTDKQDKPAQEQVDKQTKSAKEQVDKQTKSAKEQVDKQTKSAQEQIDKQTKSAQEQIEKQTEQVDKQTKSAPAPVDNQTVPAPVPVGNPTTPAQTPSAVQTSQVQVGTSADIHDQIRQSRKASEILTEIMDAPDKGIPRELLDGAECVAVFPDTYRAGFIFGGRYGRGVATCRTPTGWSAPAYFNLGGGSWGLQIGGQSTDFVMLFMNRKGLESLMKNKFTFGGDAAATAGPVGRETAAGTDLYLNSQILVYSRSKGLFAGAIIDGSVVTLDKSDMREVYNTDNARSVLNGQLAYGTPNSVMAFPVTLSRYSSRVKNSP